MGRFGVGQGVSRVEDARLLRGEGRFSDDIHADGEVYGYLLRSPHAHAEIAKIDTADAAALPGVLAIYTAEDLTAAGIGDIPCLTPIKGKGGSPIATPPHPVLARGRVRHVGDPLAFVVAESLHQARDAAEQIWVDYEELPASVDTRGALAQNASEIWEEAPGNLAVDWEFGNRAASDEAFAKAAHISQVEFINNRVVVNPMEPRMALGEYDSASERLTLTTPSQGGYKLRGQLAGTVFKIPEEKLRVVTPDVGGAFGMKIFLYAEQVMVLFAARDLGRPVRWTGERSECFMSDSQGRDHVTLAELAVDKDGRILALRASTVANMGAYLSNFAPIIPTILSAKMFCGVYKIPQVYAEVKCVFTNTVPVDAYRGAGRPEAAYLVERLVDATARDLGLNPADFRQRNFIPPEAMPFTTSTGNVYDSGKFEELMERAKQRADWDGIAERRRTAQADGKLRGIGMAYYVEACSGMGVEDARVRLREDGGVTVHVGTQNNGQGHETAYSQLLSDKLGLEPEQIDIIQGDTDDLPAGGGTGGSRSLLMGAGAIDAATEKVIERAKVIAGDLLEAAAADIAFDAGTFSIVGTDRTVALSQVAKASHSGDGISDQLTGPIEEDGHYDTQPLTFPNGCHICELEIDSQTGRSKILRYVVVDDFGKLVNPEMVAGQVHGGTVQGIGQALYEETVYDPESGQLLTGSFMDYCMPRADNLPMIDLTLVEDAPCTTNPWGIKGAGEAGAIGAPPAVINAMVDALAPLGIRHIDMPATAHHVWQAIQNAALRKAAE